MSDIKESLDALIKRKNARIEELEEKLERLGEENLVLAQVALKKGELRELPESEEFKAVI